MVVPNPSEGMEIGGEGREKTEAEKEEEDRKDKSLGRLTQKFIQLFLVGYEVSSISLYLLFHPPTHPPQIKLILSLSLSLLTHPPTHPPQVISLSGAAEKLLGATAASMNDKGMKTKVRRLYDIANVLTSLKLIDKIQVGGWVGG